MRPKNGRDSVRVTTIADKQILVPVRDIVLVLPPTLFGSPEVPGPYEERYEVMYRRDGELWHGRAENDALIAAGLKLPTLPPWIALADRLSCYAKARMAGEDADLLVPVIERQVDWLVERMPLACYTGCTEVTSWQLFSSHD